MAMLNYERVCHAIFCGDPMNSLIIDSNIKTAKCPNIVQHGALPAMFQEYKIYVDLLLKPLSLDVMRHAILKQGSGRRALETCLEQFIQQLRQGLKRLKRLKRWPVVGEFVVWVRS